MPVTPGPGTAARVVAGRYRLLTSLGTGGMGTVWRAEDQLLGREVAVKEVAPPPDVTEEESDSLRERTLREARIAARLSHPNVVAVYDVVEDAGRPWIVMELLQARSLRDIVQEVGPLPVPEAARIGLQVLAALQAAHRLGIVHRDVKPGNVLIGHDGRAVLADFGIARGLDSPTLTATGVLVGSPSYIAPERARGQRGGPASDLWSLGATLYAAVEGRPPYERDGALPTLTAVVTQPPDPPRNAGALWPVISGLLRHDERQRLSAAAVEPMLERLARAEGPQATAPLPRPPSGERDSGGQQPGGTLGRAERTLTFHPTAPVPVVPAAGPEPGPPAAGPEPGPPAAGPVPAGPAAEPVAAPAAERPAEPEEQEQQAAELPGEPAAEQPAAEHAAAEHAAAQPPAAGPPAPGPAAAETGAAETGAAETGAAEAGGAESGAAEAVADVPQPAGGAGPQPAADTAGQPPEPAPLPAGPPPASPPAQGAAEPGPPPVPPAPGPGPVTAQPAGQNRRRWLLGAAAVAAVAVAAVLALTLPGLLTSPGAPHPRAGGTPAGQHPRSPVPSSPQPSGQPSPQPSGQPAGTAAVPAGWHRYRDPTGFSIGVPDGWQVSQQGHLVYVRDPAGGRFLLIDQTTHPRPNPLADWRQQEANRIGTYPGYHRIRLQAVSYPQAERAADWEFTYNAPGGPTHVLNRNVLANAHHAYALYWSTPAGQWAASRHVFRAFAATFQPAPA